MAEKSFTVHWRRVVEKQSHAGGQVTTWSRTVRDEKKLGQSKVFKGSHAALTLERFEPGCDGDPLSTGRSAPGAALRQITFIYGASEAGCSSPYLILKSSNRMLLCLQIFFSSAAILEHGATRPPAWDCVSATRLKTPFLHRKISHDCTPKCLGGVHTYVEKNCAKFFFSIFFDLLPISVCPSRLLKRTVLGSPFVPAYAY